MKLMELRDVVSETVRKKKKGKKLKADSVRTVLDKLKAKQKGYVERYASSSGKEKKKLEYHQKVVSAQIKKARKLLEDMDE